MQRVLAVQAAPTAEEVARIQRWESHLYRQMTGALHELQRVQAARRGADVPPPAALDVTVHADIEAQAHRNGLQNKAN
jgi:hypothetical protein